MTIKIQPVGMETHGSECERPSCGFDHAFMPTDIADQLRAAADRVRNLQRSALIEIGRALLGVKDRIGGEQFDAWLQRECTIPVWLAQHAMDTAESSVAAALFASAAPAADAASVDERGKLRSRRKPEETKGRLVTDPWVVKREPQSDGRRARQEQEQQEWGGEANVRQHHTVLAARMLKQQLGAKLDKFLTAANKADPQGILDLLCGSPAAPAKTVSPPEDEPPLPFAAPDQTQRENTATSTGARAASSRDCAGPKAILVKHPKGPRLVLEYGEMRHRCLAALRDGSVITAKSVVAVMMRDKSLNPARHRQLRSDLIKRALRALDALRRCGRVERIGRQRGVRWVLLVG